VRPGLLLQPYLHPRTVALAHLWLPGFLLSVAIGAMYQLVPVVLGTPLSGPAATSWIHFAAHSMGVIALLTGFASARYDIAAAGGGLVSLGLLLFTQTVLRTFKRSPRRDGIAWSFSVSTSWLLITVLMGATLAINRRWPFLAASPIALLQAHAHLGFVGFFLTLLQGASFQLVPMFTMGTLTQPSLVSFALGLSSLGLVVLAGGLATEQSLLASAGAGAIGVSLVLSTVAFVATLRSRKKKRLDPGLQGFVIGAVCILAAATASIAMINSEGGTPFRLRTALAYGVLVVGGGLSFTVLGILCKIIPFLVWMRAYGPRVGKQAIPSATSLASVPLERSWLLLHALSLPALISGLLAEQPFAVALGSSLLAAAVGAFLINVVRILSHLWIVPAGSAAGATRH
jgi:hypothetical protein